MILRTVKNRLGMSAPVRLSWRFLWVCLLCVLPAAAQSPIVHEFKLENGVRVLLAPRPGCGAIHAAWFIEGGRLDTGECPPETADLLLAAWFASPSLSSASGLWMKASDAGISSGRDIAAEGLEDWGLTESRRFRQALRDEQVDSARRYLQSQWQKPDTASELYALALGGNGYARQKNIATLVSTSTADVQALAGKYATADRIIIVLVGDVDEASAINALSVCFGSLALSTAPIPGTIDAPQSDNSVNNSVHDPGHTQPGERRKEIPSEARTEVLAAWLIPPDSHGDKPTLELFAEVLAGGPDSRLARRLVTELGCSENVTAMIAIPGGRGGSLFVVRADVAEGHAVHETETAIQSEVQRLSHNRLEDVEVNRAAQRLEAKYAVRLADASGLAKALISALESVGDWSLVLAQAPDGANLEPSKLAPVFWSVFQPDSAYSILAERNPIRSPRNREEQRLVSMLARLLENRVRDPSERERLIKEAVRQFGLTPREMRGQQLSLIEAAVGQKSL